MKIRPDKCSNANEKQGVCGTTKLAKLKLKNPVKIGRWHNAEKAGFYNDWITKVQQCAEVLRLRKNRGAPQSRSKTAEALPIVLRVEIRRLRSSNALKPEKWKPCSTGTMQKLLRKHRVSKWKFGQPNLKQNTMLFLCPLSIPYKYLR